MFARYYFFTFFYIYHSKNNLELFVLKVFGLVNNVVLQDFVNLRLKLYKPINVRKIYRVYVRFENEPNR